MVPVFSPKANARKICCFQLLKIAKGLKDLDGRVSQSAPKRSQLPAIRHYMFTGHGRIFQIQDDLRVSRKPPRQPKGHPKVAENPRKLSAAQLEKRQPKGLKVCSIWWARRASSLPRRRNHKKECLPLIRVSTFHNFEHQPTCLCTTLAFLN